MPTADSVRCPGCAQPMVARSLPGHYRDSLALDFCGPCRLLWFDRNESMALSPASVIDLFRLIASCKDATRRVPERLGCPRCPAALVLTRDVARTGRFVYHRCPNGHGRLTGFLQFLREKGFVRELRSAEVDRLRIRIAQLHCSNCGAPIDLARSTACTYCRSPLAVLDNDAVGRTLGELAPAQATHAQPPELDRVVDALLVQQRSTARSATGGSTVFDLVSASLRALLRPA